MSNVSTETLIPNEVLHAMGAPSNDINTHEIHRLHTIETMRGRAEYASYLGMTEAELDELMQEKVVLDLGSGAGIFAIETEYKSLTEQQYAPPQRIDSLSIQYENSSYWEHWRKQVSSRADIVALLNSPSAEEAVKRIRPECISCDWNNLASLNSSGRAPYGVIVSIIAFPTYSDFQFDLEKYVSTEEHINIVEKPQNSKTGDTDWISFGKECKNVFQQMVSILDAKGLSLLRTGIPYWAWEYSSDSFNKELTDFFAVRGCVLTMENIDGSILLRIEKTSY